MIMRLLVIDYVNFIDYPTGGIVAFYRAMLRSFCGNLLLAGLSTDKESCVGKWTKGSFDGIDYDFYAVDNVTPNSKRPIIPVRIKALFTIKRQLKRLLKTAPQYDFIFTQSHEVLRCLPASLLEITCFVSPGLSNPLSISRYPWARTLSSLYDKFFFMPRVSKVRWHLAAADSNSREEFSLRSNRLIKADDIYTFPTRFDERCYKMMPINECRKHLQIADNVCLIVTVGRLGWFKGWKLMIDAFSIFKKNNPNSLLVFIGDGEDHQKIFDYIHTLKIDDCVKLMGKQSPKTIASFLNASNLFVMGSYKEGWSTTLVEACACGVPCVVTNFSSSKEMISNGENGYVVENRDPNCFAQRMVDSINIDREYVRSYNKKFQYLAQENIKSELERIIENTV